MSTLDNEQPVKIMEPRVYRASRQLAQPIDTHLGEVSVCTESSGAVGAGMRA